MDLKLQNKVALVCGASRGIGWTCARALAAEKARVILVARGAELLEHRVEELRKSGGEAAALPGDLSRIDEIPQLAGKAGRIFGAVDILINNSGGPPSGENLSFETGDWERAFRGTFLSAEALTRELLPGMAERGWGRIVNLTSVSVRQPIDGLILSNSIRMAVIGWAKTLSREFASSGVTINNIATGNTLTARIEELARERAKRAGRRTEEVIGEIGRSAPIGRMARPEEVATAVLFLAGEPASYITGVTLPVDGGYILAS